MTDPLTDFALKGATAEAAAAAVIQEYEGGATGTVSAGAQAGTLGAANVGGAVPLPKLLLPGELEEFNECERIIERHMASSIEMAEALATMRDKRLYRVWYDTWEEYIETRWGFTARRARQLCQAADTLRIIGTPGASEAAVQFAMPASEKHVRMLHKLPEAERRAAWIHAVTTAPKGVVTPKHLAQVIAIFQLKLGLTKPEQPSEEKPSRPAPHAQTKAERLKSKADEGIACLREILALAGTADSIKSANLHLALNELQDFRDHLINKENLYASRP